MIGVIRSEEEEDEEREEEGKEGITLSRSGAHQE